MNRLGRIRGAWYFVCGLHRGCEEHSSKKSTTVEILVVSDAGPACDQILRRASLPVSNSMSLIPNIVQGQWGIKPRLFSYRGHQASRLGEHIFVVPWNSIRRHVYICPLILEFQSPNSPGCVLALVLTFKSIYKSNMGSITIAINHAKPIQLLTLQQQFNQILTKPPS